MKMYFLSIMYVLCIMYIVCIMYIFMHKAYVYGFLSATLFLLSYFQTPKKDLILVTSKKNVGALLFLILNPKISFKDDAFMNLIVS